MNIAKTILGVIVLAGLFFGEMGTAAQAKDEDNPSIKVYNAWVRLMPPSERTSAAFMEIDNNSNKEIVLERASSEAVGKVELHQMSHVNGMMKMAMVPSIAVPSKGKVMLDEEGYHLMLINLKESLKKDQLISITLHFKGGEEVVINAVVTPEMTNKEKVCSSCGQRDFEEGKKLYLSHGCVICHGKEGDGEGLNAKNYDPLPTDFRDPKKYLLGFEKKDIIYSIKNGGSRMPKFRHLSDQELEAIADYLVSLQQKGK